MVVEEPTKYLEKANNFPTYLQNFCLAFLAILVPLAISITTEIYRKKERPSEDFAELDLHVILDDVFRIKRLLIYSMLMFLPYTVWDISSGTFRLLEIIISIIGIRLTLETVINVYRWVKGSVFKYRFSYLKKLKDLTDLEVAWRSVWKTKNINPQNEREFFEIFSVTIENKMKSVKRDLAVVLNLLNDFLGFLKERSITFLVGFDGTFPKILELNFIAWKKEYELRSQQSDKNSKIWINWHEISRILTLIIRSIEERAFEEQQSYLFFTHLQKHMNSHKNECLSVKERKRYYVEDLLSVVYQVLFEKTLIFARSIEIWNTFPEEWKVTLKNIKNKENLIARITLKQFLKWAHQRIMSPEEDYDKQLDYVSYNLFPEVDPMEWAVVLIFVFSPFSESRVKSVIERRWTFGLLSRTRIFSGVSEAGFEEIVKQREAVEIKNTYELAIFLFPNIFSKKLLERSIKEAKALKYADGSEEERKRLRLIKTLQGIADFLNSEG